MAGQQIDDALTAVIEKAAADATFSGVVAVDRPGMPDLDLAFGLADRRWGVAFTPHTVTGTASATKGVTALVTMSLIEQGVIALDTTARSLLGDDLPLIDDRVTIGQLLSHRSGIGDYLDEDLHQSINDYVMPIPVHRLDCAEAYLDVLAGFPQVSQPGERFAYNNGGFVVLGILAERAAGVPYAELVDARVCAPAGMADTRFIRSDALPTGVASGYLEPDGLRTNILHLPLIGIGDGGVFTTVADMRRFWAALFAGSIVAPETLAAMTTRVSAVDDDLAYGLGFWLRVDTPTVFLEGYDAGVAFRSLHDPERRITVTVIGNTSEAAWPVLRAIGAEIGVG